MSGEYDFTEEARQIAKTSESPDSPDVELIADAMRRAYQQAREQLPPVNVAARPFASALSELVTAQGGDPIVAMQQANISELYLATGCALADTAALADFEQRFVKPLPRLLASLKLPQATEQDVMQAVREKLLVPQGDTAARILKYAGRGSLRTLVGSIAMRTAISTLRKTGRDRDLDEEALAELAASAPDPELGGIKQQYRVEFKSAFQAALAKLSVRERNVLRFMLVDRLTVAHIGTMYDVHRTTVSRWLATIRRQLAADTREQLAKRLSISDDELNSMVQLIQSKLDLSLERILVQTDE